MTSCCLVMQVWGEGETLEEMLQAVADYPVELKAPYAGDQRACRTCCVSTVHATLHVVWFRG